MSMQVMKLQREILALSTNCDPCVILHCMAITLEESIPEDPSKVERGFFASLIAALGNFLLWE